MGTNRGEDPIPSGGMEIYVEDLVRGLEGKAKTVVVTRKFRGSKKYQILGGTEIHRVGWLKGRFLRTPSFMLSSFLKSMKLLCRENISLIYTNGPLSSFVAYFLSKLTRTPLVCRPAGLATPQYRFPLKQIFYLAEKLVYPRCSKLICHSDGERENLEKNLSVKLRNAKVIMTGFPVEEFQIKSDKVRKEFHLEDSILVTSISRLAPVKGLEYLIKAMETIYHEKARLLLVGSGPHEKELRDLVRSQGLGGKVIFAGFREDIPEILASTDIFVVSSLSEGLPTSLLEAMAAGKPCIVTDIGLPIENQETGLVIPPASAKRLAVAIKLLISNPKLRKKLGENAREFAEKNCALDVFTRKHMKVFREVKR